MSRVGKHEIKVPSSVTLTLNGHAASAKGKFGEQAYTIPDLLNVERTEGGIKLTPSSQSKEARSLWGTANRLLNAMVKGVDQGFTRELELKGVGYRASVQGSTVVLQLAYSHDINYALPQGVTAKCDKPTSITLMGASPQMLGQVAAEIRKYRKPEPYKGKGIIRQGEFVLRKEGKKK